MRAPVRHEGSRGSLRRLMLRAPDSLPTLAICSLMILGWLMADPVRSSAAGINHSASLWGVSESGLELGKGSKAGTDYLVPNPAYYLQQHVRLIRLPFKIDRMQPEAGGPLDQTFVNSVKEIIRADQESAAVTVLDPHDYGFYNLNGQPADILRSAEAARDYVDFMRRIALAFAHEDVAIGLMNEPHTGSDAAYSVIWNQAIAAIRAAGFKGTILVPHAHWGNAADISPQHPFAGHIIDPGKNWVLELHLYFDPNSTGTYQQAIRSPQVGRDRLAGAIAWSRETGTRLFLGETGAPADPMGMAALNLVLDQVAAEPRVFWGIALWGAGSWWKPSYPMRLDPINGMPRPQFLALRDHFLPQR